VVAGKNDGLLVKVRRQSVGSLVTVEPIGRIANDLAMVIVFPRFSNAVGGSLEKVFP
jgi:hypothetical protein